MRLNRIELIRYGKFTDSVIELPKAEHDFHVVVGPNEAGKSTLRAAIVELLFNMPQKSAGMAFLHLQTELRLGAIVQNHASELAFHRAKSTKAPLRSPSDSPLPSDALANYLGGADRAFFEQMFSLDHAQLVKGGQTILDASKDVGQVLFQSAAGIASLGRVRDGLETEAQTLWAPRKANDRAFYIAATRLEEADRELKESIVKTRAWSDARAAIEDAAAKFEEVRRKLSELEETRTRLERVRRLAPHVQTLRTKTAELDALGQVVDLPDDAAQTLSDGAAALAVAERVLGHRQTDVERLQSARDEIKYDRLILSRQKEIEALEAYRHRVRDHGRDLVLRRLDVERQLDIVRECCIELQWPGDLAALRAAPPSSVALKDVDRLLKDRGALQQARTNAEHAVVDKETEVRKLERDLEALPDADVAPELRAALAEVQALRNNASAQRTLASAFEEAQRAAGDALAALGKWTRPLEALKGLTLPSAERMNALRNERVRLDAAVRTAHARVDDATRLAAEAKLAVEQYSDARRIVTVDEVRHARAVRDDGWRDIRSGKTSIEVGAPAFDAALELADQLVDSQLEMATEAAELQGLRQRLVREDSELARLQTARADRQMELQKFDVQWATAATEMTLEGMPVEDVAAWLVKRDEAIGTAAVADLRKSALERERAAANAAASNLARKLRAADVVLNDESLLTICVTAEDHIRNVDLARERRESLTRQLEQGRRSLENLKAASRTAQRACLRWEADWADALAATNLGKVVKSPSGAEAALELVRKVQESLSRSAEIQRDRIDSMNADLDEFMRQAVAVLGTLDPSLPPPNDAAALSRQLGQQLQEAREAQGRYLAAEKALSAAEGQRNTAALNVKSESARVQPLLTAVGATSPEEAAPLVQRSDKKRQLLGAIEAAKTALIADADGLGLEVVLAEVGATDVATLAGALAKVTEDLEEIRNQQTSATEVRLHAQQAFARIAGSADAAVAEAKRQEALADMAEASERYLKVRVAARLLRWAIDKYRDRKQGPMLSRAGTIFCGLTSGRFKKLLVDYDKEPLSLAAQRVTGEVVEVTGLSEGTRDQLYLALRLAALELHLDQSTALPFVADDLFINFDEERCTAGLEALRELSTRTQVLFLSHHDHLLPRVRQVFGDRVNVVQLQH